MRYFQNFFSENLYVRGTFSTGAFCILCVEGLGRNQTPCIAPISNPIEKQCSVTPKNCMGVAEDNLTMQTLLLWP